MRVAVITNFPSYHSVDVFNQLATQVELKVFYLRQLPPGRQWTKLRDITHDAEFVKEWRVHQHFYLNPGALRHIDNFRPQCLVVTQYASIAMQLAMYRNSLLRRPWVYWSEAPGVAFAELPIFRSDRMRRIARRIALAPLRLGPKQVWGIGVRARDAYAQCTGAECFNVPYYSDQSAFRAIRRNGAGPVVRFLYCGKLIPRKGFDVTLRAIERLSQAGENFQVLVVGDGPDRSLLEGLSSAARTRVEYVGFKELAQMPEVYAAADVLVFPSRYDGWGMALIEAMAAGMPVLSTPGTGAAIDYLRDGENGFFHAIGDDAALAEHMKFFIHHPEKISEFGARAKQDVAELEATCGSQRIAALVAQAVEAHQ